MKLHIIYLISIVLYTLCNYSNGESDLNINLLYNGGVKLNEKVICPISYSGDDCSLANTTEPCNHAYDKHYGEIGSICCWSKYRAQINLAELQCNSGENQFKSDNDKIVDIFETYGPYFERDIMLAKSILDIDQERNQYKMKYKDFFVRNQYNNQFQVDSDGQSLGFIILIHNIDMDAITNIFRILYQPYHYYVIHIDKNYKDLDKIELLNNYLIKIHEDGKSLNQSKYQNYPSNIKISNKRFNGEWGTVSLVYMELSSYTDLFDLVEERSKATNSPSLFTHMINLSSNDMITKSLKFISKTLFEGPNINKTYIHCCMADVQYRYDKIYYENNRGKGVSKDVIERFGCGLEQVQSKNDILDGSQWHFLSSRFVHFLITSTKSLEKLFSLKFSLIPDESFFQNSHRIFKQEFDLPYERDTHRITLWANHRYEVSLFDLDSIDSNTYFIRKVYNNTVRNRIIEQFNVLE